LFAVCVYGGSFEDSANAGQVQFLSHNFAFLSHNFDFLSHNYDLPWGYFFLSVATQASIDLHHTSQF